MKNSPTKAFIFAAGLGTRMMPLTEKTPKPLIKVAGKALLDYQIELALNAGIKQIGINSFYLAQQVEGHVQKYLERGVDIRIFRENERLETGGGLMNAMEFINYEPIFTINSDVIFKYNENPLSRLMKNWDGEKFDLLMLFSEMKNAVGYYEKGNYNLQDGYVVKAENPEYVFTGVEIINTKILKEYGNKKIFSLSEVFSKKVQEKKCGGLVHDNKWLHIGCLKGLEAAELELKIS